MTDPNDTLAETRRIIDDMSVEESDDEYISLGAALADKVEALDNWLTGAGPFPQDWVRLRNMILIKHD